MSLREPTPKKWGRLILGCLSVPLANLLCEASPIFSRQHSKSLFLNWVEYFGKIHGIVVVAVPPQHTSQDCSRCGHRQKKTLSTRTHQCVKCGLKLHRDHNSAIEIRKKGLQKLGASTALLLREFTPVNRTTSAPLRRLNLVSRLDKAGNL